MRLLKNSAVLFLIMAKMLIRLANKFHATGLFTKPFENLWGTERG